MNAYVVYERPRRLSTRLLPPLPKGMGRMVLDIPTRIELSTLPTYRMPAVLLLALSIGLSVLLVLFIPVLIVSPILALVWLVRLVSPELISGLISIVQAAMPIWVGLLVLLAIVVIVKNKAIEEHYLKSALREEQWFRSGSEEWTFVQRLISCAIFGLVHINNLIFPVAVIVAIAFTSGGLMLAYTQEYRISKNIYRATLASAKFHARYNVYALRIVVFTLLVLTLVLTF